MSELKQAIQILVKALNEDESYRYGWQANIAVQFQDEFSRALSDSPMNREQIHKISNQAAINFLNLLCEKP
jgi:hypothetical protein